MLVLGRKKNETIQIGDNVEITVCQIGRRQVRLGISAPVEIQITRSELLANKNVRLATTYRLSHADNRKAR